MQIIVEQIPGKVAQVVKGFRSHKTLSLSYRKEQLRNLYFGLQDNMDLLQDALIEDLHKGKFESNLSEFSFLFKEIEHFIEKIDEWAAPESVELEAHLGPATAHLYKQPYGTVLVVSPWNYPVVLSISPIAAALASGNTVVFKPSELVPNVSRALIKVLETCLDPEVLVGVSGGIPQSTAVLKEKFDKILYTGNGVVGRIVSRAAAEHLTPTVLELGGKSPVIVTKTADLQIAAHRVLWGKQMNAGQTCVAPDYILVEESIKAKFIEELGKAYNEFFPELTPESDYGHIVNDRHFARLAGVLSKSSGKVLFGGKTDPEHKFIAPTVVDNVTAKDSLMQDELFGPLIGLITIPDIDAAIDFIVKEHDTPLALYIYSTDKAEQEQIISKTRSGSVAINDNVVQTNLLGTPFGGFGESGTGSYHGKYGFDAFTHKRTVFSQTSEMENVLTKRYPPYTTEKYAQYKKAAVKETWLPRSGPVKR